MANAISQLIATQAQRTAPTSPMQMMAGMQQLDMNKQRMRMNEQAMAGNEQAMLQQKRQEGLKFAGNVGAQMRNAATPEEKAKIYATSLQIAKMNGHDVSAFPTEFGPEAEQLMEGMYQQVFQPEEMKKRFLESAANAPQSNLGKLMADRERIAQAGGDTSMFDEAIKGANSRQSVQMPTSSQRDFATYQQLLKTDPEQAKVFGRQAGFVSKEGQDLSAHMEKRLSEASDDSVDAVANMRKLEQLAGEFENADLGSGLFGSTWPEMLKKVTGQQDAVTALRKKYNGIRASQAMANLPPGAASDIDVKIAMSEFPDDNANGEHIAQWMRGVVKLEQVRKDFADHKTEYISANGHERGMLEAWENKNDPEKGKYSVGQIIEHGGKRYKITGDPNDPDVELIE